MKCDLLASYYARDIEIMPIIEFPHVKKLTVSVGIQ